MFGGKCSQSKTRLAKTKYSGQGYLILIRQEKHLEDPWGRETEGSDSGGKIVSNLSPHILSQRMNLFMSFFYISVSVQTDSRINVNKGLRPWRIKGNFTLGKKWLRSLTIYSLIHLDKKYQVLNGVFFVLFFLIPIFGTKDREMNLAPFFLEICS